MKWYAQKVLQSMNSNNLNRQLYIDDFCESKTWEEKNEKTRSNVTFVTTYWIGLEITESTFKNTKHSYVKIKIPTTQ